MGVGFTWRTTVGLFFVFRGKIVLLQYLCYAHADLRHAGPVASTVHMIAAVHIVVNAQNIPPQSCVKFYIQILSTMTAGKPRQ